MRNIDKKEIKYEFFKRDFSWIEGTANTKVTEEEIKDIVKKEAASLSKELIWFKEFQVWFDDQIKLCRFKMSFVVVF